MKKWFFIVLMAITIGGCKYAMENIVKEGYFYSCPDVKVEELFENYFENTKWESFIADDGTYCINVTGNIMYNNSPASALVQFMVFDDDSWEIYAFEINKQTQDESMVLSLITDMCPTSSSI
jgi:hypothetical protein